MKQKRTILILVVIFLICSSPLAYAGTSYGILTTGCGIASSSQYTTYGTVGQAIIGTSRNTDAGFLSQVALTIINPPPTLKIIDLHAGEYSKVEIPVYVQNATQDSLTVFLCIGSTPSKSSPVKVKRGENTSIQWTSFQDFGYVYQYPDVVLQLIPSDGKDYGDTTKTVPFKVTNLIGDFTYDLDINGEDVPVLLDIWNKKDTKREIGPAQSTPPNYNGDPITKIQPDITIDILDLAVFGWMWNWSTVNPQAKFNPAKFVSNSPGNDGLYAVFNKGTIEIHAHNVPDYVWLIVESSKEEYKPVTLKRGDFWDPLHTIEYQRRNDNIQEVVIAHLDHPKPSSVSKHLADIESTGNALSMTIYYAIRFAGEQEAYKGVINVSTEAQNTNKPVSFKLFQNFPNPFNPRTTISYTIPEGKESEVKLQIFDLRGSLIRTLVDRKQRPGMYSVEWEGTDDNGKAVSSGAYIYRLNAREIVMKNKMLFLK